MILLPDHNYIILIFRETINIVQRSESGLSTPNNFHVSNSSAYSQNVPKQSDNTSEQPETNSSFDFSNTGMNGTNICDHIQTTNDESNNNNNIKSAKKSKLSSEEEKSKDNIEDNTTIMEDSNDLTLVYENERHEHLKHDINDHLEVKEYEKEKYPQGHE